MACHQRSKMKLKNPEIRIEPTNLCNYSCIMCPRDKHTRKQGVMSMEMYQSIIDESLQYGVKQITLTNFGEPFIDPTLEEKIKIATDVGLKTYVITNASLWDKPSKLDPELTKIESAVKAGLKEIRISFYGFNKEEYGRIMVGGNFDRVVSNLKLLRKVKDKYPSVEVSVFVLQFEKDINENSFPQELKDVVDYYEVWKPHNFGNGRDYREISGGKQSCGRPQNGPLQINWDGTVVPCCYDYNQEMVLGKFGDQTIKQILSSDAYNKLRDAHNSNDYSSHLYCNNCDQLLCSKINPL